MYFDIFLKILLKRLGLYLWGRGRSGSACTCSGSADMCNGIKPVQVRGTRVRLVMAGLKVHEKKFTWSNGYFGNGRNFPFSNIIRIQLTRFF
ncbi:hypothetical protein Hanom_Chr06g00550411 [Helianthus anomalus]